MSIFTLKKVIYSEALSQETPNFKAEIWEGGKKIATVSNDGWGGGNMVHSENGADVSHLEDIETECKIFEMVIEEDLIKKKQSKGLLFKEGEEYFFLKFPLAISKFKKHPQFKDWINSALNSNPDAKILNRNVGL